MDAPSTDGYVEALLAHVEHGAPPPEAAPPRERALLVHVLKLTRTPAAMQASDAQALRDAGFDDAEILDAVHVASYYAYANRIAEGLGLVLEPYRK